MRRLNDRSSSEESSPNGHRLEAKVCSCSQGKSACSHYGALFETLKLMRDGQYDESLLVRKMPSASPFDKLRQMLLLQIVESELLSSARRQHSNRVAGSALQAV